MKNLILILAALLSLNVVAQKITIPDTWTDASAENLQKLTAWVVKGELSGVPGTKEFYISSSWNPSNTDLNTIAAAGGNTDKWPLYLIVNDTNFFYQKVHPVMGDNIISIKSLNNNEFKTWGEYLRQSHEIYYRPNSTPPQFLILAADVNGKLLKLSEVITIRNAYSEVVGYMTIPTLNGIPSKLIRNQETGIFE